MKERTVLCIALVTRITLLISSTNTVQPVAACYGPHITANISKTEVHINETVTITGQAGMLDAVGE